MAYWLVKGDPSEYGAAHLEREEKTTWTGVTNPLAQRHLRSMAAGDEMLVYHTGGEKSIVARGRVVNTSGPDPKDKSGRAVLVEIAFSGWLKSPVELAAIKSDKRFADFDLVRNSRLSVMPVSKSHWDAILKMADSGGKRK